MTLAELLMVGPGKLMHGRAQALVDLDLALVGPGLATLLIKLLDALVEARKSNLEQTLKLTH